MSFKLWSVRTIAGWVVLVASITLAFAAAVTGPNQPLGGWLLIVVLIAILAGGGGMAAYLLVPGSPDAPDHCSQRVRGPVLHAAD